MGMEERNSIAKPKSSKKMDSREDGKSAKSHKHNSQHCNGHIQHSQECFPLPNSQLPHWDSTLPIPGKGKDIASEKNLGLMRQFKGNSEVVGLHSDRSSRIVKQGTRYRNYIPGSSMSVACGDEASLDESDETDQDLSAMKKQRLDHINADDYLVWEDSEADMIATDLNLGMSISSVLAVSTTTKSGDDSELRKQRRRESNREAAKRSRLRKQQECEELQARIEVLKADASALCKEFRSLSEECERIGEKNKLIKEEIVQMFGPSAIYDQSKA